MHTLRVLMMAVAVLLCMPLSVQADAWVDSGWQKLNAGDHQAALTLWQQGVNRLPDKRLLASLGAYSELSNALAQLKRIGADQKGFIVRSDRSGARLFYVLSSRDTASDIMSRQHELADLKQAAGISGLLFAADAEKFKLQPVPADYFSGSPPQPAKKPARVVKAKTTKTRMPKIRAKPASNRFSINRFEISGNALVPTDLILMSLRDFYGPGKTRSDLNKIRRQVLDIYNMSKVYRVKVKKPKLIDEDTVQITIIEK